MSIVADTEPGSPDIHHAVAVLRAGGLVGMPTETVYGLAGDARNETAIRRIFAAKGRPADHPLIVHLADHDHIEQWAMPLNDAARLLANACWPGPLTLLLRRHPTVLDVVTGGRDTVGIRIPAHPVAHQLLRSFGGGLAAPSANRFGGVSPTSADHVRSDLGEQVDCILDGGHCPIGVESTIVDCSTDMPQILRPGGIPTEDIVAILGGHVHASSSGPSRAPGMLESHYAPRCAVMLAPDLDEANTMLATLSGATLIDGTHDLVAYAHNLYALLRNADAAGATAIVAVMPPPVGLGHAIRDRLMKAAAARPQQ